MAQQVVEISGFCRAWDIPIVDFRDYDWVFCEGVQNTLAVSLLALPVAALFGLLGCWGKLSRNIIARGVANTYTTVVRGIPELVMILLCYYGLTILLQTLLSNLHGESVVIDIDRFTAGVVVLGTIYGAFMTEVFRGAYLAVDRGQIEAARAYGMSRTLAFRRVVLPQMLRFAIPGFGNTWMVLVKATALTSVIQLPELMQRTREAAGATKLFFNFYFGASVVYLIITIISIWGLRAAERWANRGVRRA